MTKNQEQALYDSALADLPDEINVLGPFYRGYVQGVLTVIKQLREGAWEPTKPDPEQKKRQSLSADWWRGDPSAP